MGYLRPFELDDVGPIYNNLREADYNELVASISEDSEPLFSFISCCTNSPVCQTLIGDNYEPIGVFGYIPEKGNRVKIWMVGTDAMSDSMSHVKQIIRTGRQIIEDLLENFQCVYNYVDERNTIHQKWLEHMGFDLADLAEPYGPNSNLFRFFYKCA